MKQFIVKHKKAFTGTVAVLMIGGLTMSFQDSPFIYSNYPPVDESYDCVKVCTDTVPDKESLKMIEFEKLQADIDRSLLQVTEELKKMDLAKIQRSVEASLRSIDMEKIRKDVDLAIKKIDMDKVLADVNESLKDVRSGYRQEDVEKALAEARKEIENARLEIKEIDKESLNKQLIEARKEIEKAKKEINKIDLDKVINEAREEINKAKIELNLTNEMFNEMERDGLISSKKGFTVEYRNKELFIDGKKQPTNITDKYRKYFKKDSFKMTIDKE
jgi:chromosome segregation ATPase